MLLVGNGPMITRDAENPFYGNGCVAIDGGVIKEIGSNSDMTAKYPSAR